MAKDLTEDIRAVLVEENGILTKDAFDAYVESAKTARRKLEEFLLERGVVASNHFAGMLAKRYGVKTAVLNPMTIDPQLLGIVSEAFVYSSLALPYGRENGKVLVAMADPTDSETAENVKNAVDADIDIRFAFPLDIKRSSLLMAGKPGDAVRELLDDAKGRKKTVDHSKIDYKKLLERILAGAYAIRSSDVHIEPFEDVTILRYRVDGILRTIARLPRSVHTSLVSRVKVLSKLKIDEHRLPQDGRFTILLAEQRVDVRTSIAPAYWGEKVALRLLPKGTFLVELESLGLLKKDREVLETYLERPYGMIIVTGPTGSGKTTTLYAAIEKIGRERMEVVNLSTVEDPIEFTMDRVTQLQVYPDIGMTFAEGLRTLLRQDPDIILLGEIRDHETAEMAVRSSLVGRLLLTSMHTNTSAGAIPRLIDLGVESYLVSSTLSLIVAQRLVRKLCLHCRESYEPDSNDIRMIVPDDRVEEIATLLARYDVIGTGAKDFSGVRFFKSHGCERCDDTGYAGRTGLFELLEMSDELRDAAQHLENTSVITDIARRQGLKPMIIDGLAKAILGITDIAEVKRAAL